MEFKERKDSLAFFNLQIYNFGTLSEYDGSLKGKPFEELDQMAVQSEAGSDPALPGESAPEIYRLIAEEIRQNIDGIIKATHAAEGMHKGMKENLEELADCYEERASTLE
tara:strand:- start:202 stop:531 length:330 start_codon:yes stop_codon:yes gene_type:complete